MSLEKDYKYLYLKYKNKYLSLKNPGSENKLSGNEIIENLKTEFNLSNFYNIPQYAGFFFGDDSDEEEEIVDNVDLFGGSEEASPAPAPAPALAPAPAPAKVETYVVSDTSSLAGMSDLDALTEEEEKPDDSSKKSQQGGAKNLDDLDSLSDSVESISISDTESSEDSD